MAARVPRFVAAAAAIAITLAGSSASACDPVPGFVPPPSQTGLHWGIAIASVAAIDATVLGAQLALNEELFPDWLAGVELGLGIAHGVAAAGIGAYGVFSGVSSCDGDPWQRYGLPGSVAMAAVGGWLFAHAIWSLAVDDAPDVLASIAMSPESAQLVVVGTF